MALDGKLVDWERIAIVDTRVKAEQQFQYIKYWKPKGVVCTSMLSPAARIINTSAPSLLCTHTHLNPPFHPPFTPLTIHSLDAPSSCSHCVPWAADERVRGNIIHAIGYPERIFPVGRLDKDSTGLILLTNDGRLPNAVLRR